MTGSRLSCELFVNHLGNFLFCLEISSCFITGAEPAYHGCAIVFGDGLLGPINAFMGIDKLNVAEIVPIALREHVWPASRIISIAIKLLRKKIVLESS